MFLNIRLGAVVFCLFASGCSSNDLLVKKQIEMDARFEQLVQANASNSARLAELSSEVKELGKRVTENSKDLDLLKPGYQELKTSYEGLSRQGEGRALPAAASRIVVENKSSVPRDHNAGEEDAYMQAFGLYSTNNYRDAINAFTAFLARYPASEYAVNAQYWIGECYYTQGDFTRALEEFAKVSGKYPQGKKVPDAMLKVGFSLISLNQPAKARAALEALVEQHPKSPAAAKARERLGRN